MTKETNVEAEGELVEHSSSPLVFISHDSRDAKLAEAFSDLLTGVSADVVALLTPHSIGRPWILFEAGVAKGNRGRDSVVFGVELGVPLEKSLSGPFSQFQNCGDDEDELTKLVMQLIRRVPNADPNENAIRQQVKVFREQVSAILKQPVKPAGDDVDATTVAKLFEEVKVMFRDLPQQVEAKLSEMGPGRRRRRRKLHPMMFEEIFHRRDLFSRGEGDSDALIWLLFVSVLKDNVPWLYELGMEVYRALRSRDPKMLAEARREFHNMARAIRHGHPMFLDMFAEDEDSFGAMRHLPMLADDFLRRLRKFPPDPEPADQPETGQNSSLPGASTVAAVMDPKAKPAAAAKDGKKTR